MDWLIVDGNNFLHAVRGRWEGMRALDFEACRRVLVRRLDESADRLAGRVTVVYDGHPGGSVYDGARVDVRFAGAELTADTVIERLVRQYAAKAIGVVSDDRNLGNGVRAGGATLLSCGVFADSVDAALQATARQLGRANGAPLGTLRDAFAATRAGARGARGRERGARRDGKRACARSGEAGERRWVDA